MITYLPIEDKITNSFIEHGYATFKEQKYGIHNPLLTPCCPERWKIKYRLLDWEKKEYSIEDQQSLQNMISAGVDQSGEIGRIFTLTGVIIQNNSGIEKIQWTQLSGPPAQIKNPDSLITNIVPSVVGKINFILSVTDSKGSIQSDLISLQVSPAPSLIYYGFYDSLPDLFTIYYPLLKSIKAGSDITFDFSMESNGKYISFSEPITEPIKTLWDNFHMGEHAGLNYGKIPDQLMLSPVVIGDRRYYCTRKEMFFSNNVSTVNFKKK